MAKILVTEKQLEVLTSLVLREQESFADVDQTDTESDMEKYKHKSSSEVGEFKTYLDGDPYALFMDKSDILSKAILQSGDYTELESKSLYYPYRRPNPYAPGGYFVEEVQEDLDDEIENAIKNKANSLISDAKSYGWFRPNELGKGKWCQVKQGDPKYCLGETHLEEFGDIMKVYAEKPPDPMSGDKGARNKYKKYKEGTYKRYYLDKKAYKKYLIEKYKDTYIDHEGVGPKLRAKLKKYEAHFQKLLKNKLYTETYQYSKDSKGKKSSEGWEKNPDYNPEGAKEDKAIAKAKKKVGDINFSAADRINVMDDIQTYVSKNYDGNYEAAMSDDVWEKKGTRLWGSGWVKRGVKKISLTTANIKTKTWTPEVVELDNVGTQINFLNSDVEGQLFLNNLWKASGLFISLLDEMVENIKINQQNVSDRFDGVKVNMSIATEICSGGGEEVTNCETKVPYPYTISSSCSQVPNGVNDKGEKLVGHGGTAPVEERISFEQLSKNRANTAKTLISEKLGSIGITMSQPVINWQGANNDGTSGPAYKKGGPVESEAYKKARYVRIKLAIMYEADVPIPDPPKPETYKVGDFKVTITPDYKSWDPWWPKIPPFRWPRWKKFKNKRQRKIKPWMTIKCPNFKKKGPRGSESMW